MYSTIWEHAAEPTTAKQQGQVGYGVSKLGVPKWALFYHIKVMGFKEIAVFCDLT